MITWQKYLSHCQSTTAKAT